MARKTFISYKYSEAQDLRDRIIDALGEDAVFYKGETSESPDLTDMSTEKIKSALADMMFDTSVTIVIVSPCMTKSKWIPWGDFLLFKENNKEKSNISYEWYSCCYKESGWWLFMVKKHPNELSWARSIYRE